MLCTGNVTVECVRSVPDCLQQTDILKITSQPSPNKPSLYLYLPINLILLSKSHFRGVPKTNGNVCNQCARNKIISLLSLISLVQPDVNVFVSEQMIKQITRDSLVFYKSKQERYHPLMIKGNLFLCVKGLPCLQLSG